MIAKLRFLPLLSYCLLSISLVGCALFRYSIIPQEKSGPHGGALALIDQRISDYIEFVAISGEKEWIFQVFVYDKNLKQRSICGSGYITIELADGTKKGVDLWNTKPYFWSKGKGHLENKMQLNNVKEFLAYVSIRRGSSVDRLTFKYPYNSRKEG